ncbi:MAG: hypothetical protein APF81_27410 [Desulfosporosinus sp. BRH_c37]|nr:MAG: hypothetical protein APF81_27410 [Desulfosporosinus sp. BRH_c37]
MTDRKAWFIDFARIAGRRNLNAYLVGVIKSILCCNYCDAEVNKEIRNALDSMDTAFNDKSLPWDVLDAKKPSAPTESPKEISLPECTINLLEGEPLFGLEMTEEWVGELEEQV